MVYCYIHQTVIFEYYVCLSHRDCSPSWLICTKRSKSKQSTKYNALLTNVFIVSCPGPSSEVESWKTWFFIVLKKKSIFSWWKLKKNPRIWRSELIFILVNLIFCCIVNLRFVLSFSSSILMASILVLYSISVLLVIYRLATVVFSEWSLEISSADAWIRMIWESFPSQKNSIYNRRKCSLFLPMVSKHSEFMI